MSSDNVIEYIVKIILNDFYILAFFLFVGFWILYVLYVIAKCIYTIIYNCYAHHYNKKMYKKIINIHNREIPENDNETCCICLEDYSEDNVVGTLPCNHNFHDKCISVWFDEKHTCPLCQKDIALREILIL